MRWGLACLAAVSACSMVSDEPTGSGGTLLAHLLGASELLVDDDFAYVTGGNGSNGSGIVRVPLDGGPSSMLILNVRSESMDDSMLYFSTASGDGGAIMRMPKDGGAPTLVASGLTGWFQLQVDDSYVYMNDGTSVERVAKAGGTPEVIAATGDVTAFVVDDTDVYWIDWPLDGGIGSPANVLRASKDGGPTELVANNAWAISALGIDDGGVYWGAYTNDESGLLVRFDKATSAVTVVCSGSTDCLAPEVITTDATHVLWTGVERIDVADPDADGGFTPLVRTSTHVPDMKVRGGKLFWLDVDYDAGMTNLRVIPEP